MLLALVLIVSPGKPLAAIFALKYLQAQMSSFVVLQVSLCDETFWTESAFKGFHILVDFDVVTQASLHLEYLSTPSNWTLIFNTVIHNI